MRLSGERFRSGVGRATGSSNEVLSRTDVHVCDVLWNGCSWFGTRVCGLVRVRGGRWGFVCATQRTGPTNQPTTSLNAP